MGMVDEGDGDESGPGKVFALTIPPPKDWRIEEKGILLPLRRWPGITWENRIRRGRRLRTRTSRTTTTSTGRTARDSTWIVANRTCCRRAAILIRTVAAIVRAHENAHTDARPRQGKLTWRSFASLSVLRIRSADKATDAPQASGGSNAATVSNKQSSTDPVHLLIMAITDEVPCGNSEDASVLFLTSRRAILARRPAASPGVPYLFFRKDLRSFLRLEFGVLLG